MADPRARRAFPVTTNTDLAPKISKRKLFLRPAGASGHGKAAARAVAQATQDSAEVFRIYGEIFVVAGLQLLAGKRLYGAFGPLACFVKGGEIGAKEVMGRPVRCWIMSIQWEPMSPMARSSPLSSEMIRQFQSVSYNSQSCE